MTKGLERRYGHGHLYFITCSGHDFNVWSSKKKNE